MPKTTDTKRTEANARKLVRSKLTKRQQLSALDSRPGDAKAERARLA